MLLLRHISILAALLSVGFFLTGCQGAKSFFESGSDDRGQRRVPEASSAAAQDQWPQSYLNRRLADSNAQGDTLAADNATTAAIVAAPPIDESDPAPEPLVDASSSAPPLAAESPISAIAAARSLPAVEETATATEAPAVLPPDQDAPPEGTLHTIYFDADSTVLSLRNRALLQQNAAWLLANPDFNLVVEGHTDSTATEDYNMALGAKRAEMIATYIMSLGVSPDRLSTISYGESRPIDPAPTRAAHAKNRRVQFLAYRREAAPE